MMKKPTTCKYCLKVDQHFSFQCPQNRKPIKKTGTPIGSFTMTSNKTREATKTSKSEKGIKELKELAQTVVNRHVKKIHTEYDGTAKCYTCAKWFSAKEMDASHFISVKNQSTRYDLDNLKLCCIECNRLRSGALKSYRQHLVQEIGEVAVEELEMRSKEVKHWTKEELLEIIAKYK